MKKTDYEFKLQVTLRKLTVLSKEEVIAQFNGSFGTLLKYKQTGLKLTCWFGEKEVEHES